MLAPSPTGGIRCAASPTSVTSGVDGQVRPIGSVLIDRGTTTSSQAAISAVNRASQPGSRSISLARAAAGSSNGIPLVANQSSSVP